MSMEERDLSNTSSESHFLDGQDWFCWKRFQTIQFYFESSVACEMATHASEVLFCPWVSNAEVMDAWRISWSVVFLRLVTLSSSLQFLIPFESLWAAQRTDKLQKEQPQHQIFPST